MQPYRPYPDDAPTERIVPTPTPGADVPWLQPVPHPVGDARLLEPGDLLAGRYRIQERIGSGGMGVVYRAFDQELGICIAVKVLRPDLAGDGRVETRLRRELLLNRQVSHRNAVRIHDIGQDGGYLFLTLDLVEGRSLREVLRGDGPLSPDHAVGIARQLALALEAAHAEGIIHRDLKPPNVLVNSEGRAWITDFGVARSLHDRGPTRTGSVIGTLAYLSPEQARGEVVDGRSDLYALGILLFEMLTGELPFKGGSTAEDMAQRLTGASKDIRTLREDVPAWLASVIRRLLQRDPDHRFQSARELIDALDEHSSFSFSSLPLSARRAGVLAAAASLALAWVVYVERHQPDTSPSVPAVLASAVPRHTVAVLPLADETGKPDLSWIGHGLAEMLATDLAESPSLRVVDSSRVFQTLHDLGLSSGRLSKDDLRRLAEMLDADRLVAGRLWAAGGRLRVDLDLTGDGSARVQAQGAGEGDVFAMASALGRALRERLAVEPPPLANAAITAPERTASPAALRAYQRGVDLLIRRDVRNAVEELRKAVKADPAYTPAWVRLARALADMGLHGQAMEAASRAAATPGAQTGRAVWEVQALDARLRGEPEKARELLGQLVARHPYDTEAWIELAEACREQGDLNAALATLRRVVTEAPTHPRAWFLLAKASIFGGDSRRAADEYLVRALVIQNRLGSEAGRAEVLNAMGIAWRNLGEPAKALEALDDAVEIRRRLSDERGLAATLRNLASVQMVQGDHGKAEQTLGEALTLLQRLDDPAGMAELRNDLGALEEERGRYAQALEHYRYGLQLRRPLGQPLLLAESLRNVGWASYLLGRFDDGMVYWSQGLELSRRAGDKAGIVYGQQDLGMLQIAQGDWDAALKSFLDALRESRELELPEATASSLGHIGRIAMLQGRFPAALSSFGEALTILKDLDDLRGQAEFTLAEAETWLEMGDLDNTGKRLDAAEKLLAEEGSHEQKAELLRLRAEWHQDSGAARKAAANAANAVAEAEASGAVVVLLQARLVQASLNGRLSELRRLNAEADRLGHRPLQLRAAEALAEAALASGDASGADAAARSGIEAAEDSGSYARTRRLEQLLDAAASQRAPEKTAALPPTGL
ncbi:MAG: eukaryotic-like serine/threonine-protein kinase [Acidobacteriota bacterium]|jgi:serine/threonine protein kinase/tetratricopeptide (TPR) repeat protein|nr:eukaryotic-like serine/threonine-protein kinase [Acidobacteriota bacterium]